MKNKPFKKLLPALAVVLSASLAHAEPIEFIFSGTADFELGDTLIEGARFDIRTTAMTEALTELDHQGVTVFEYANLAGTLFVEGLGDGQFTSPVGLFHAPAMQMAGYMAAVNFMPFHQVFTPLDILNVVAPELASYDMKSDLAVELAQAVDPQQWYQVKTSLGPLTAYGFRDMTLQAKVSPVPEVSSAAMWMMGGALWLAGAAVRRSRSARRVD